MIKQYLNKVKFIIKNRFLYIIGVIIIALIIFMSSKYSLVILIFPIITIIFLILRNPSKLIYIITIIWEFTTLQNSINIYIKISIFIVFLYVLLRYKNQFKISRFYKIFFVFIIYNLITYMFSYYYSDGINIVTANDLGRLSNFSIANLLSYLGAWLLSVLTYNYINSKRESVKLLTVFIFVGNLVSIFCIILYLFALKGIILNIPQFIVGRFYGVPGVIGPRLFGTAYEPLAFGNQTAVLIPITLGLFLYNKKIVLLIFIFIESITLLLTLSTGAMSSLAVSMFIMIILMHSKLKKVAKGSNFIVLTSIFIILIIIGTEMINYTDLGKSLTFAIIGKISGSSSLNERNGMNEALINIFKSYPIFGVGIGRFVYYLEKFAPPSQFQFIPLPIPVDWKANNDYLTVLAETGAVGFMFLMTLIIHIIKKAYNFININKNDKYLTVYIGLFCSILIILLQMTSGFFIYNYYLWILVGVLLGLADRKYE